MSTATTRRPLAASARSEHGRKRPGPFRLVDAGHQHPAGAVAPELDLLDVELELGRRIVRRHSRMGGVGPHRARGARGGHQLDDVTPVEGVSGQCCLPSNDLVAAMIACFDAGRSSRLQSK
jgi:hypothetical protein